MHCRRHAAGVAGGAQREADVPEPNMTFVPGANGLNSSSILGTITSARDPRNMQLRLKLLL
jgi:hypothetical protein